MPTEAELISYYNSSYTVPRDRYRDRVNDEFPVLRELLNHANVRPGRMLEIGCSYGHMLARFAGEGWGVEGVELDARAAAHAREELALNVHTGSLEDARGALCGSYDVIAMYHVIEHVRCVGKLANSLASLLVPGGVLVLRTPNAGSLASRLLRGWWEWSAAPEHVHLFTSESLRMVLGRAGFDPQLMLTRRGDAHGAVHELIRGAARCLLGGRPRGERVFEVSRNGGALSSPISQGPMYSSIARVLDVAGRPLDWLLELTSRTTTTALQPELLVVARRSVTPI